VPKTFTANVASFTLTGAGAVGVTVTGLNGYWAQDYRVFLSGSFSVGDAALEIAASHLWRGRRGKPRIDA